MIRLALIIFIIVIVPLVVMGIQPTTANVSIACDEFSEQGNDVSKDIKLDIWKDYVEVSLCSGLEEGLEWRVVDSSYKTVWVPFQQKFESPDWTPINHKFESPENSGLSGSIKQEIWTFPSGNGTITMEYGQPGEGGTMASRTFTLSVVRD